MNTDEFVHELSRKSNFRLSDCREFLSAFIDVFDSAIKTQTPIEIVGFGKLTYIIIPEREGNDLADVRARLVDPNHPIKKIIYPESTKVNFKLAVSLREFWKGFDEEEEIG